MKYSQIFILLGFLSVLSGNIDMSRLVDNPAPGLLQDGDFLLDTSLCYTPVAGTQMCPVVSFDGTNYLVAWQDNRTGIDFDIYAARVDTLGNLLDSAGILVSISPNDQTLPFLIWGDTNYLITWCSKGKVYAGRVEPSGVLLDTQAIATGLGIFDYQAKPVISFDGTNYFILSSIEEYYWYDWADIIYGKRVSQQGVILDPNAKVVYYKYLGNVNYPQIDFDGTNYLVAWSELISSPDGFNIYGVRVNQEGLVIDTPTIGISTVPGSDQGSPDVAFGETSYLVVFADNRNGNSDIYCTRVSPEGVVFDTTGIKLSAAPDNQLSPRLDFSDENFFVIWQDKRDGDYDIYGARIDTAGIVIDTAGIRISGAMNQQTNPAIKFGTDRYLGVWEDSRCGLWSEIFGTFIDLNGNPADSMGFLIPHMGNRQNNPACAFDGTNYFVVWEDARTGYWYDIYGIRLGMNGTILDSVPVQISSAIDDQRSPAVAFDGTNYLVVWEDRRSAETGWDIWGARVSTEGVVLDPGGFAISTAADTQTSPAVCFGENNYLVSWEDKRAGNYNIYCARVSPSGLVLDPNGIPLPSTGLPESASCISFDNNNFLVVWGRYVGNAYWRVYGARVSPAGVVLDPAGICITNHFLQNPSVTFDGGNYFVVGNTTGHSSNTDIWGARVSPDGVVLDTAGIDITHVSNTQIYPSVVFDGDKYVIMWQDYRNGFWDIYGSRVTTDGIVIDSIDAFPVVMAPGAQVAPALAHGTGNMVLLTYSGFTKSINSRPANTMRIWAKFYSSTGIEENEEYRLSQIDYGLEIRPNPAKGILKIRFNSPNERKVTIKLYDVCGRLVHQENLLRSKIGMNEVLIKPEGLSVGVYFVNLESVDYKKIAKVIFIR